MFTSSKYLATVSPTCCAFCNKRFAIRDGYFELWRTADGRHFCSEFCADDAEEAQFQNYHRPIRDSMAGVDTLTRA